MQTSTFLPIEPAPEINGFSVPSAQGAAIVNFQSERFGDGSSAISAVVLLADGRIDYFRLPSRGWRVIRSAEATA